MSGQVGVNKAACLDVRGYARLVFRINQTLVHLTSEIAETDMIRVSLRLGTLLLILVLGVSSVFGQSYLDRKGIVRDQIMTLVKARFGPEFIYVGYSILDSLIAYSTKEHNYRRQDPYSTLKGCILFSTYKDCPECEPDTFVVGMIRNGRIIWDNFPGSRADLGGHLIYAQDLNNDGEVDLLIREVDRELLRMGRGPDLYYLYVLSWNGSRGRFINSFLDNGKSALVGWLFEPVHRNASDILAIEAALPDLEMQWEEYKTSTFPHLRYTWNGKDYGLWINKNGKSRSAKIGALWWHEARKKEN
jgi:hypothetical protein